MDGAVWARAAEALAASATWVVVGYSFPSYDDEVRELLRAAARRARPMIHLFSGSAGGRATEIAAMLGVQVVPHGRLPECTPALRRLSWI